MNKVQGLQDQPGFVDAFVKVVDDARGKVCAVCGLELMGHAPESKWLGYEKHEWDPTPADYWMLLQAQELSSLAYRMRTR